MTANTLTPKSAAGAPRLPLMVLGPSLSLFFAITYVLCVLYGLVITDQGFHRTLLPMMLPGFTWLTWSSFVIGLVWSFGFGWYIAAIFTPLFNFFAGQRR